MADKVTVVVAPAAVAVAVAIVAAAVGLMRVASNAARIVGGNIGPNNQHMSGGSEVSSIFMPFSVPSRRHHYSTDTYPQEKYLISLFLTGNELTGTEIWTFSTHSTLKNFDAFWVKQVRFS